MKLKKIKLFAIDSDGVVLNDTYSPAIKIFVESLGVEYTPLIERSVWGSPQITAGHNLALACKLPYSGEKVIKDFFRIREQYIKDHPVEVHAGIESTLELLNSTGAKLTCYGGRNKEYSFDRFLTPYAKYFDKDKPYIDINAFRPGVFEIVKEEFKLNFDEVVFIDDINRVAEVCKALNTGFIGVPASMPHNFQREEMMNTGVKFMVNKFTDITKDIIHQVDRSLSNSSLW
ncbi:HAD family hydrolase [Exercitatus varius]|uniref:HAD family hydrolase n=1 Tax=Exercitatus varius TaxID=67857 RepID=UPI00294B5AE7|nr:HAD family hydrolase [Exercitatus varius]MDG2961518.1 HAD family hydrolase [Exercitatus varius]